MSSEDLEQVRGAIKKKYAEVSQSAMGKFKYTTGKEGAAALGYDPLILQELDSDLLNSYCGVGNPFSLGNIEKGNVILDVGCGAGFDLIVANAGDHATNP